MNIFQYMRKRRDGDFDESAHPRAENGQFGEGAAIEKANALPESKSKGITNYGGDWVEHGIKMASPVEIKKVAAYWNHVHPSLTKLTNVDISDLHTTQSSVEKSGVIEAIKSFASKGFVEKVHEGITYGRPMVIKLNGKHILLDGHHRTTAVSLLGHKSIPAKVFDLDEQIKTRGLSTAVGGPLENPKWARDMLAGKGVK